MRHPRARIFFALYACAIVYLSLYPWEFQLYPKVSRLFWIPLVGRRTLMDAALNLLFYTPLGAAGFLALRRGWLGWFTAIAAGASLSWAIEWLQLWSRSRYGNLTDLTFNVAGAVVGASVAFAATRLNWIPQGITRSRWRLSSAGVLFLAAWMLWQMFPFIPALSLKRLTDFEAMLAPWSWRGLVETCMGLAVLRFALLSDSRSLDRGRSPWMWLALAALPAQTFLVGRSLALSSLCGGGLGWAVAEFVGIRWLGIALPGWLLFEELRPFSFTGDASPFAWAPFGSWYEVSSDTYYPVIFGKLFLYLSVIWALRKRGASLVWSVGIPAAILAGGEWAQRYIPGRSPESTDVILLVAAAVLLAVCRAGSELSEFAMQRE